MSPQLIIQNYLQFLEASDYEGLISLFTKDAIVESPLYGTQSAAKFYQTLLQDTNASQITLIDILESPSRGAGYFRYQWTLKSGEVVTFDCVDIFEFNNDKIQRIQIIYDTYSVRSLFSQLS